MAKRTYADKAKSIMNKYKRRLGENFDKGDTLALEAMNQELSALRNEQEEARAMLPENQSMAGLPTADLGGTLSNLMNLTKGSLFKGIPGVGGSFGGQTSSPSDRPGFLKNLLSPSGEGDQYKSRVPWMGMASGIVGNLLMNKKIDLPEYEYEEYKPSQVSPNLVNYGREREQVMRERDLSNAMLMGASKGVGSQAGLMENLQAGMTGTQRTAGQQFGQSLETEGNVNAQIMNETQQMNEANRLRATEMNNRNKMYATGLERENMMIDADRKDARTAGIMSAITGYGKDRMAADQYDQMLEIATPENYRMGVGQDSSLRRLLGVSPTMKRFFNNTDDTTSNTEPKKEKGGQLSHIQLFGDEEYEKLMMRSKRYKTKK